jgi:micrococcal nuclease
VSEIGILADTFGQSQSRRVKIDYMLAADDFDGAQITTRRRFAHLITAFTLSIPLIAGGVTFAVERVVNPQQAGEVSASYSPELLDDPEVSPAQTHAPLSTHEPAASPNFTPPRNQPAQQNLVPTTTQTPAEASTAGQPHNLNDANRLDNFNDQAETTPEVPEGEGPDTLQSQPTHEALPPQGAVRTTVTRIIDGDTIEVSYNGQTERVRLVGIDTPERGQAGVNAATEFTRQAIAEVNDEVYLQKSGNNRDRFDRLRRVVWLPIAGDFVSLNDLLLEHGHARVLIVRS